MSTVTPLKVVAMNGIPQSIQCGRKEPIFSDGRVFFRDRTNKSDVVPIANLQEYETAGMVSTLDPPLELDTCDALLYARGEALEWLSGLFSGGQHPSSGLLRPHQGYRVVAISEAGCVEAGDDSYEKLREPAQRALVLGEYEQAWSLMDIALLANFADSARIQWEGSLFMGVVALARSKSNLGDVSRCFEAFALDTFGESRYQDWLSYIERMAAELALRQRLYSTGILSDSLAQSEESVEFQLEDLPIPPALKAEKGAV